MKNLLLVLGFFIPSVSFAAPLTQIQANSLISVVQSSTSTPAVAFVPLITSFSNITVAQAESLINVVQLSLNIPANAFVGMLVAFTVDPVSQLNSTPIVQNQPVFGSISPVDNTSTTQNTVVQSPVMTPTISITFDKDSININKDTNPDGFVNAIVEVKDENGTEYPYNVKTGDQARASHLSAIGKNTYYISTDNIWFWEQTNFVGEPSQWTTPFPVTVETENASTTQSITVTR